MNTFRTAALAFGAFLALAPLGAHALFKVIGPDGRVTYTDRAPQGNEGKVMPVSRETGRASDPALPFALRQVASRFPVTLYTMKDCGEACALAPVLLPPTPAIFGRASKPASHWLYIAPLKSFKFQDPVDNSTLLELRSTGLQTVFPGSVHPTGELIEWQTDGIAAYVAPSLILQAVRQLAIVK